MKIEKITYRGECFVVEAVLQDCSASGDDAKKAMKNNLAVLSNREVSSKLQSLARDLGGDDDIPF
jgi:hypothetical protein